VLQLFSPFKIELSILVPKELIDRLHDTFIASKTSTTKQRGASPENMGDGEEFQSRSQLQHPLQLGMCELAHCRAGAERLESVCPSFYVRYVKM
jgi:hypothetical protein